MWASPFSLFGRFPKPAITYQVRRLISLCRVFVKSARANSKYIRPITARSFAVGFVSGDLVNPHAVRVV
jgi:hypothetical protein